MPVVLALAVAGSAVAAGVLLLQTGWTPNLVGFLVGAVAGPLLLITFRVLGNDIDLWRWVRPLVSLLALAGWLAGAAHVWFVAVEASRWVI